MLLANNVDKVRLLLDFKAPLYLIPYLNTDNSHVRLELVELFALIARGFSDEFAARTPEGAAASVATPNKSSEETAKALGVLAHIHTPGSGEDRLDR